MIKKALTILNSFLFHILSDLEFSSPINKTKKDNNKGFHALKKK